MGAEIIQIERALDVLEQHRATIAIGMEDRSRCPACSAESREVLWSGRFGDADVRAFIEAHGYAQDPLAVLAGERFELVRCRCCDLRYHARVLDADGLTCLYETWIDDAQIERFEATHVPEADRDRLTHGRQLVRHLLRMHALAGSPKSMKVLDFGCGDGRALRVAGALGMDAVGVDSSATRAERAARVGCVVRPTLEAALEHVGGCVDAILMCEVLEHLVAPREVLEALASALRPGGVILLETPDARGIEGAPGTFEQMRVVHPLEHVNAFTPITLERLARRVGLRPAPRVAAHATTRLRDVVRTELACMLPRRSTSAYFIRP